YIDGIADGGNIVYTVSAEEDTTVKIAIHYLCTEVPRVRAALVSVNGNIINEDSPLAMTTDHKVKKDESSSSDYKYTAWLEDISLAEGSNQIIITGAPAGTHTAAGGAEITINDGGYLNYVDYLIVTGTGIDFGTDTTPYYTFGYASENAAAGFVTSETAPGSVLSGTKITVTAEAKDEWKFECWSDGTTENPRTFELTKNTAIFAHFIPKDYTLPSGLVGYATITNDAGAKYTISGGAGGETIEIAHLDDLTTYKTELSGDEPYIVTVVGTITTADSKSIICNIGSNKTIYGDTGNQGRFKNIEMRITGDNVIVRNMKFGEVIAYDKLSDYKGEGNDALSLNGAKHVWIDHCEFRSNLKPLDNEGNSVSNSSDSKFDKDWYDGLLDVKNGATWITVSNCYFHDHWKAVLCGSGDDHDDGDSAMRITFCGNYWKDINARQPLFRWGKAHIFNSYFHSAASEMSGKSTGINCRAESDVYIDHNYFENIKTPIGYYNDEDKSKTGHWVNKDNQFDKCTNSVNSSPTAYEPPYTWKPTSAEAAKADVVKEAGVGKLSAADLQ
ncbi:MAG: hypothetical protein K2K67_02730, partial [Treponemataceae bacterium]|nr:hypothetical protein [Treponemataceae bacterium]